MVYVPIDINEAIKKECLRRGYSIRTIETYQDCIKRFIKFSGKSIDKIGKEDALNFLYYLQENGKSGNTLHVYHMAIRFLMEDILRKNIRLNIKYSKRPEKLPLVLSKEECKSLFNAIANEKHRLMIQLLYGAGLRASELLNLKIKELNLNEGYGFVRNGKGNKDRIFIIPESLKPRIIRLITDEKLNSENYLFTSNRNNNYDIRSLQEIIKKASRIAYIKKKVHPHTLRHSFATHLIEQGNSLQEVQALLGHKSPETTQVYLHTASKNMINIKSPIDSL